MYACVCVCKLIPSAARRSSGCGDHTYTYAYRYIYIYITFSSTDWILRKPYTRPKRSRFAGSVTTAPAASAATATGDEDDAEDGSEPRRAVMHVSTFTSATSELRPSL
jgi:hypothetical protein